MDDATQDCKDLVVSIEPLLKLYVFVPKRMRQKVESNAVCCAFEQPSRIVSGIRAREEGGMGRRMRGKRRIYLHTSVLVVRSNSF